MADKEDKYSYPKEKIDLITSSSIAELMQLLDEISVSKARTRINNDVLSKFIVPKYKNEKDNLIKYGRETKENYCKALKGELKGYFGTNKKQQIKSPQEVALNLFNEIIYMWCLSNVEIDKLGIWIKEKNGKIIPDYEKLTEMLINAKDKVSKETLSTFYKFAPIDKNKNIEKDINEAPYRLELFNKEHEKDNSDEKLENLNNRVEELESELKNKKDYDEIKQAKEKAEEALTENKKKHAEQIDELKKEHQNKLDKQIATCRNEYEEKLSKQKEEFDKKVKILQEKSANFDKIKEEKETLEKDFEELEKLFDNDNNEQIQELKDRYKELEKNYNELIHKKVPSGNLEKARENFKKQINEKEKEIESLNKKIVDLEEQIRTNKSIANKKLVVNNSDLSNFGKFIKENLKSKILKDEEFKENFKRFVLSDKALCEFIIKNSPKLKEAVVLEVANRRDQRNIDKELKINTNQTALSNEYDVTVNAQEYMYSSSRIALLSDTDPDKFKSNLSQEIEGSEDYISDLYNKMNNFFVVLNSEEELYAWMRAQKNTFTYPPLDTSIYPDFDWLSYKDWFGYFKDNGVFIPSVTGISDYYKGLNNNPNIPMGIVVFRDYNRVMPSIYLETFIKSMDERNELPLINSNIEVNERNGVFRSIKKLDNLKFVFIKKSDSKESFNTPDFMKQYEVKYTSNNEGIDE